jgi:hypothetical protein
MPGMPRDVAEHSLDIRAGARPVKQPLRRFDEEKRRAIGKETHKLMVAKSIKEAESVKLNPEPLLRAPGGYTHLRERPLVIAKVLEPGTYKLAGGQGEVYGNAWDIRQLRHFYPQDVLKAVRIPRSHTSLSHQGRVGLASAEPDPPSGAKKGGTPLCQDWVYLSASKIFGQKGFCVLPAMSEAGPQGANVGACKWQGRLSRGTPMPPG